MISLDNSNCDTSRVGYGCGDVEWEWFHPFLIHIQYVNNQICCFFYTNGLVP